MTRNRTRVPVEGSFAQRLAERAARRDLALAETELRREQRVGDKIAARLLGPPAVNGRGGYTSAQLCSVHPLVCDPGLGVDGPLIGQDVYSRTAMTFDLHELHRAEVIGSPNMVVTGEIRSAKSSLLKTVAFRGIPFGQRFYVTDVKGEYDRLAAAAGIVPLRIGPGLGTVMNPLAGIARHDGQLVDEWLQVQRARRLLLLEGLLEIQLGDALTEAERSLLEYALDAVTRATDGTSPDRMPTPTLSSVLEAMGRPQQWQHRLDSLNYDLPTFTADSRRVRLALERLISGVLGGIFDGPATSNTRIDFAAAGAILDLRAVRTSDQMTAMAMTCAQSWLESELTRPGAPTRVCIYDEFALIARHLGLVRRMREQLKLARALGTANILAFHRFSDLAASGSADSEQVRIARGLIEDTGVRVSYRQPAGSLDAAREFLGTTDVETELLGNLRRGVGLWKIGNRSYVIKHQLSAYERDMVDTDGRMRRTDSAEQIGDDEYESRVATVGEAA